MMEETKTEPPIQYDQEAGPKKARFFLYPIIGVHEDQDVKKAMGWLNRNHTVGSVQIRWKRNGEEVQPEKIPDFIMVKHLRKEIGELQSQIQELEYKLQQKDAITKAERNEIKKTELYQQQQAKIKQLEKEVAKLRKDKEDLIIKLNQK